MTTTRRQQIEQAIEQAIVRHARANRDQFRRALVADGWSPRDIDAAVAALHVRQDAHVPALVAEAIAQLPPEALAGAWGDDVEIDW